jgi:hypothetical protein
MVMMLNILEGNNFRQIVCNKGSYTLANGLLAEDISRLLSSTSTPVKLILIEEF